MVLTFSDFIAGWIGGICGVVVGHPLDTIKVRQQTLRTSFQKVVLRTYAHEGVKGFFKGMFFPLVTVGPGNALLFGIYGNVMKILQQRQEVDHRISLTDRVAITRVLTAGIAGGFAQTIFSCPWELIKTLLQVKTEAKSAWSTPHYEVPYHGSIEAFMGILKTRGVRGMFRGLAPLMLRDVPTSGLYILTYEMLMYYHFSECETRLIFKQIIAGGTAGVVSWVLVCPLDVVKSRIQTDNPDKPIYKSMTDCIRKIYEKEGIRAFFRGTPALLIRTFPVNAALFLGYETALQRIRVD